MENRRATALWLLVALGVFAALTFSARKPAAPPPPSRPSWQHPVSELSAEQQAVHEQLRAQLRAVERARSDAKQWPPAPGLFPEGFALRQQGITVNYLGEAAGLRWLVLFLEPDPRLPREPAPREDDEHHTLPDGTPLHVTLWTQPLTEPAPSGVIAFPAAEGWVERVRR